MDRKLTETPGTDEWWTKRLSEKLAARAPRVAELRRWLDGDPELPFPDNQKPGFERLQRIARVNVAELIVEARLHRMQVLGAKTRLDDSANGDDMVAQLFEEQDLERKFHEILRYALGMEAGYGIVTGAGQIRVSGPLNTIVETDAAGKTVAALSIYRDHAQNRDVMILARPGYVRHAWKQGATMLPGAKWWTFNPGTWELGEAVPTGQEEPTVYEFTPVDGMSIIAKHLPTMERINHGILQRLILIAMQAFRQRALKNAPVEDEDGQQINYEGMFETAPDSLWLLPEDTEVWESGQADFGPVLNAVKDDLRFLAVESKTPLFMISPDDANGSAEGAATQREVLVFDVEAQMSAMKGQFKRLLAAALRARGETERADPQGLKLMVANPRRSSIAERAQAANVANSAGIPFRTVMEHFAELPPEVVEEALELRSEDMFLKSVAEDADSATG